MRFENKVFSRIQEQTPREPVNIDNFTQDTMTEITEWSDGLSEKELELMRTKFIDPVFRYYQELLEVVNEECVSQNITDEDKGIILKKLNNALFDVQELLTPQKPMRTFIENITFDIKYNELTGAAEELNEQILDLFKREVQQRMKDLQEAAMQLEIKVK